MILHSILNFLTRYLIILIIFETFDMIIHTMRMNWIVKHMKNRISIMHKILEKNSLPEIINGKKIFVVYGKYCYNVEYKDNKLDLAGIYLNMDENFSSQLQELVKENIEMIEKESHKLFFKSHMLASCEYAKMILKDMQKMIEEKK